MKSNKRVVIFGAAGRVGSLLVEYALADGYAVIAFIHRHHHLPDHSLLSIVQGDIYNDDDVRRAVKGADMVMSALSSWGTKKKDVLSTAMTSIIPAMQQHGVKRIISLTGAEARAAGDHLGVIHRFAHFGIGIVGGPVLRDGERHIQLLEQSDLDWVVVRSPIMRSNANQSYALSDHRPRPWALINRSAVARAMVDQLSDDGHLGKAPYISVR